MANGDEEPSRPIVANSRGIPEPIVGALNALASETRQARHSQANLFQQAIAELDKAFDAKFDKIDGRINTIELGLAANAPASMGTRLGSTEQWIAVQESTKLPARVDLIESKLDKMEGSLAFLKWAQTIVGLIVGVLTVVGVLIVNRP